MSNQLETKITAARTRLILDHPFIGSLVLCLPTEEVSAQWCKTIATDTKKIYFNPEYLENLSRSQIEFLLAHEALHCALSHFNRRGHRERHRWDVACDYAINPLLKAEGLEAPRGTLFEESFKGMTAEEIYPFIDENTQDETIDSHLHDNSQSSKDHGGGKGKDNQQQDDQGQGNQQRQDKKRGKTPNQDKPQLSHTERARLDQQWQQRLVSAIQQAQQMGKLGDHLQRLVEPLVRPKLPWRNLLAHYVSNIARDDYSYSRPSSRRGGEAIFPSLRSGQINLFVAIDTSGSISNDDMQQFVSELDSIKGQINARVTLHACDEVLAENGPWCFEPWDTLTLPNELNGGGGTAFTPIFEWLETQDVAPDLLVYFTDALGEFPKMLPTFPIIWLVKGDAKVPWGQRIQLN